MDFLAIDFRFCGQALVSLPALANAVTEPTFTPFSGYRPVKPEVSYVPAICMNGFYRSIAYTHSGSLECEGLLSFIYIFSIAHAPSYGSKQHRSSTDDTHAISSLQA